MRRKLLLLLLLTCACLRGDQAALAIFEQRYLALVHGEAAFERLLGDEPQDYNGLIAEVDGRSVGLTHYLFHRHGWKVENVCYLQDLYVDEDVRGCGAGRALIEAVYAAADTAGNPDVYWQTQHFNSTGRRLYDRVGKLSDFIIYERA